MSNEIENEIENEIDTGWRNNLEEPKEPKEPPQRLFVSVSLPVGERIRELATEERTTAGKIVKALLEHSEGVNYD